MQKTNVRIVAATNVNMPEAIQKNKFREDLYYRLSTVEIHLPALRKRKEDISLLFRKFASDFAQKYRMPTLRLDENAQQLLVQYHWNGNIRQLRNVAEQISVLEQERLLTAERLRPYLPNMGSQLPALVDKKQGNADFSTEREILYKVLFDMKSDLNDLKKLTLSVLNQESSPQEKEELIQKVYGNKTFEDNGNELTLLNAKEETLNEVPPPPPSNNEYAFAETIEAEEPLSLLDKEIEMIKKALDRSNGKRKLAAEELGISERTLYRKIKQYDLNEDSL